MTGPPDAERRPGARAANLQNINRGHGDKGQDTTPGLAAGVGARDAGMALAAEAADNGWRGCVERAVAELVRRGEPFTVEDVRELGVPEPAQPAAWGAAFRSACLAHGATVVGYEPSSHRAAHARVTARWQVVPR